MKLGNSSQSVVPVPNMFLTRHIKDLETFNIKSKRQYFRESDLFNQMKDINLSNNFRVKGKKFEELNIKKYVPPLREEHSLAKTSLNFPNKTNNIANENFKKYIDHLNKTNIGEYINPQLKTSIRNNVNSLIDRINSNFDLNVWNKTDIKGIYNKHQDEKYLSLTVEMENQAAKFQNTLRNKIDSLSSSIKPDHKENTIKYFLKTTGKLKNPKSQLPSVRQTLRTAHSNTIDETLRNTNMHLYERTKNTNLFNDFPSATRSEFLVQKGEKIFKRRNYYENKLINHKFKCEAHKDIFPGPYKSENGVFKHFLSNNEAYS